MRSDWVTRTTSGRPRLAGSVAGTRTSSPSAPPGPSAPGGVHRARRPPVGELAHAVHRHRDRVAGHQPAWRVGRPRPTPAGVPVASTVPGSRVIASDRWAIICGAGEHHVRGGAVLAELAVHPGPHAEGWGSGTSSAVTTHGPMGPWVSKLLPERHGRGPALPVPHAHVVDHRVAGHHLECPLLGHVAAPPSR